MSSDQSLPANHLQILLASRPEGRPGAENFCSREATVPSPGEGEVLVRNVYLSVDPAMRGWMSDRKSYIEPVQIDDVMRGLTVGVVVGSTVDELPVGTRVSGPLGWQEYAVTTPDQLQALPPGQPLRLFLGPLGMTGLTAYFGLLDIGQPKEGETVVVSGAAGAVGSVVGQIAKLKGCRVVGIAGTPEKCAWLRELGFDAAIDYKVDDVPAALREHCPRGIDIYFDNVGGEILDACLAQLRRGARIPLCGAISQYNEADVRGPSNYLSILVNRARMEGFIVFDYAKRYGEALQELGRWVAEGKIDARFDVVDGLENAPEALNRLFDGANTGKQIVQIGPEPT
ncbi:MAG: NADP-dependent oxidoreductase [Acidobacteriota bacterium]